MSALKEGLFALESIVKSNASGQNGHIMANVLQHAGKANRPDTGN